jgi:hypothetical protein
VYAAGIDPSAEIVRVLAVPAGGGAATAVVTYPGHSEVLDVLPERGLALLNVESVRGDAWMVGLRPAR